jgi:EF hand
VSRTSILLVAALTACCGFLSDLAASDAAPAAKGASRTAPDGPFGTGPEAWDANGDGTYTCDEWKSYLERWFAVADSNHDGKLTPAEYATIRRPNTFFADADFGYFDENQDGKITHQEFVGKQSEFILQNDKNGDCRVTPDELKAGAATAPKSPGGRGKMQ